MHYRLTVGARLAINPFTEVRKRVRGSKPHLVHVHRPVRKRRTHTGNFGHPRAQQTKHREDRILPVVALWTLHELAPGHASAQQVRRQRQHGAGPLAQALDHSRSRVPVGDKRTQLLGAPERGTRLRRDDAHENPVRATASSFGILLHGHQQFRRRPHPLLLLGTELLPALQPRANLFDRHRPTDMLTDAVRTDVNGQLQDATNVPQQDQEELYDARRHRAPRAQHGLRGHVHAPALGGQLHADTLRVAAGALFLLAIQRRIQPFGDQALQRFLHGRQMQSGLQPRSDSAQELRIGMRALQLRHGSGNFAGDVRPSLRPRPRVYRRVRFATLMLRASQLLLATGPQNFQQCSSGAALDLRPLVAFAKTVLPQRARKSRQEAQLHTTPFPESRLPPRLLERLPSRHVLHEQQVLDVLHTRDRNVANPGHAGRNGAHQNANAFQRHALRLPMRQRPRQRQRELLSRNLTVGLRRHRRGAKDRHPVFFVRLTREESTFHAVRALPEIHLVELHDHAQRRALRSVLAVWVEPHGKHETAHPARCAVHEASLDPLVRSQQHARANGEPQLGLQTTELLVLHALSFHAFRPLVDRTDAENRHPRFARQSLQTLCVVHIRAVEASGVCPLPVHQQRGVRELAHVNRSALLGRTEHRFAARSEPTPIIPSPLQIRHPARDLQELLRVLPVASPALLGPRRVPGLVHAVRLQKKHDIFELFQKQSSLAHEIRDTWRVGARVVVGRLVQPLALVRANRIHRNVA